MKKPLIIGNWKLHGNECSTIKFITTLTNKIKHISKCHIAIAPPLLYLSTVNHYLINNSNIKLCAQNVDIHLCGAFTGDISASMLKDLNVQYTLIGHSERRIYHKENNSYIAKKFIIAKKTGLIPILCIGENLTEHNSQSTKSVCTQQINEILKSVGIELFKNSIIAYEPVWAIGSGTNADPIDVQSTHKYIRHYISRYNSSIAEQLMILYGGSVNPNNAIEFLNQEDIDGILVGSASINLENFLKIIEKIEKMAI